MLRHSPPLPLIVDIESMFLDTTRSYHNITSALQYPDRVVSISVDTWMMDLELSMALDKTFPALETFSLLVAVSESPDHQSLFFPNGFSAPHLHVLYLGNVDIIEVPSLISSAATSLVSLRFEQIEACSYFPPDELAECVSSMPQLEKLSIGFLSSFCLPDTEREFWDARITRIVLPSLQKLTFRGDSAYLEKLLALISTPLLQCFDVEFFPQCTLAVQHVSEFLFTIQNLDFRAVTVSFSNTVTITYGPRPTQTSDSLSCVMSDIDDETDRLNQQVATMTRISASVGPALKAVEDVALKFDRCYVPDDFPVRSELWRTFLRSFGALRTLRTDVAIIPELSKVLNPDNGTAEEELLPMLSELIVVSRIDLVHNPFASLIHARSLAGRAINFQVIKRHSPPPRTSVSGPFDPLYERYDSTMDFDYANLIID